MREILDGRLIFILSNAIVVDNGDFMENVSCWRIGSPCWRYYRSL